MPGVGAAFFLIFLLWIGIWGGIGAAVASSRGIGTGMGFALGAALGLIGIVILLFMKPRAVPGPAGPSTYGVPSAYGGHVGHAGVSLLQELHPPRRERVPPLST